MTGQPTAHTRAAVNRQPHKGSNAWATTEGQAVPCTSEQGQGKHGGGQLHRCMIQEQREADYPEGLIHAGISMHGLKLDPCMD
jgi:hypothetical protein